MSSGKMASGDPPMLAANQNDASLPFEFVNKHDFIGSTVAVTGLMCSRLCSGTTVPKGRLMCDPPCGED
jgi:hypothetical protein